ncbi:MAG: hypothetical protein CEO19_325 [Parcubacteria group bacterium Gr01-1014_73]|nr:MAG: hypothetical protein CEO19_325 [Parcubacteria group bacterium Gr01-1014_73]
MNNFNKNLPYTPPVQPAAPKSELSTYIIIAVIAFALGLGSGWLWTQKNVTSDGEVKDKKTADNADKETNQTPIGNLTGDNSISVKEQTAGIEVVVEQVVLTNMAWVVIHEDDGTGKPGKILGAQLFDAGTGAGKVELLRGTMAGGNYFAMLHADNGDRAFDPKLDMPILDASSQPIMATFKVN